MYVYFFIQRNEIQYFYRAISTIFNTSPDEYIENPIQNA